MKTNITTNRLGGVMEDPSPSVVEEAAPILHHRAKFLEEQIDAMEQMCSIIEEKVRSIACFDDEETGPLPPSEGAVHGILVNRLDMALNRMSYNNFRLERIADRLKQIV